MKTLILPLLCLGVLCVTLTLGLWPFHAPANQVIWLGDQNGLRFGRYGTVISRNAFRLANPVDNPEASLEIWLQPEGIWDSGTVLAFYSPGNLSHFSLNQSLSDLLLRTGQNAITPKLYVPEIFRTRRPVFITITSSARGACIYIDGALVTANSRFPLSSRELSGRLVLGDSPGQSDAWSGQLRGLAIYRHQLTAKQVFHNYVSWKQTGRPELTQDDRTIALYLFDEHSGYVVHDKARSGVDLFIPERYQVMNKIFLEPFWTEFNISLGYWEGVLKNIVGFIPFGVCFYVYLGTLRSVNRPAFVTVVLGAAVSLAIEILQGLLPTRDSGTTDLITNTLGTWFGVASYRILTPTWARFFPWLPVLPNSSEGKVPFS